MFIIIQNGSFKYCQIYLDLIAQNYCTASIICQQIVFLIDIWEVIGIFLFLINLPPHQECRIIQQQPKNNKLWAATQVRIGSSFSLPVHTRPLVGGQKGVFSGHSWHLGLTPGIHIHRQGHIMQHFFLSFCYSASFNHHLLKQLIKLVSYNLISFSWTAVFYRLWRGYHQITPCVLPVVHY